MFLNIIKKIWHKYKISHASNEEYVSMLRKLGVTIGDNCEIYKNDIVWGSEPYLITIGDNVRITAGVKFVTHDGGLWTLRALGKGNDIDKFGRIKIGNNVHIGWDSIIMPGVEIGDNCVIGCGAVVTKNIPSNTVSVGVPAKVIMTIDEYYQKNKKYFLNTKYMDAKTKKEYLLNYYSERNCDEK